MDSTSRRLKRFDSGEVVCTTRQDTAGWGELRKSLALLRSQQGDIRMYVTKYSLTKYVSTGSIQTGLKMLYERGVK